MSVPPLRKRLAEYRPEKKSIVHTVFSTDKNGNSYQIFEYPWDWSQTEAEAKELIEQIFHLKLTNFWNFWFSWTEKYASLRTICTCSLLPVMLLSAQITLPFWNESRKCNDWNFSNLSLGNERRPFGATQILSWGKDFDLIWKILIASFFNVFSIFWSTKTISWGVIEINGGEDYLTDTDRKGIWYLFTLVKMEGFLVSFS